MPFLPSACADKHPYLFLAKTDRLLQDCANKQDSCCNFKTFFWQNKQGALEHQRQNVQQIHAATFEDRELNQLLHWL